MKLLASVVRKVSAKTLREIDPSLHFEGDETEQQTYNFIREHFDEYQTIPSVNTILENTGVRLPKIDRREKPEYYFKRVRQRAMTRGILDPYNRS